MQKQYTEAELIRFLQMKDKDAFEYFYDKYAGALYKYILMIVPTVETANDTLQESFIKIWQQIHTYDDAKGRLFTWALTIARNTARDVVRSSGYTKTNLCEELSPEFMDKNSTKLNIDAIGLRNLIAGLGSKYARLIELYYLEGHTQREISAMLQMPIGTIKTRIRQALSRLRVMVVVPGLG